MITKIVIAVLALIMFGVLFEAATVPSVQLGYGYLDFDIPDEWRE